MKLHTVFNATYKKSEESLDCAHVVDATGKATNAELHEAIMNGVDDYDLRKETFEYMKASGASPEVLKLFK